MTFRSPAWTLVMGVYPFLLTQITSEASLEGWPESEYEQGVED